VIQTAAPDAYARRTKRQGIVNAFMDENFAEAIRTTGMQDVAACNHLLTPLPNREEELDCSRSDDRCLLSATSDVNAKRGISHQGRSCHFRIFTPEKLTFEQCVLDAGGSPTDMAEKISWERLKQAGIPVTSTNAIITELIKDWSTKAGQIAFPLLA
jgi:hypothetical protein